MTKPWVWVDFENTPHVLFLEPIANRVQSAGWQIRFSARQQAQTLELAALRGIPAEPIGTGDLRSPVAKALGVSARAVTLGAWIMRQGRPRLLLSCSRSASLAAWALRIPGIVVLDYEHAELQSLALGSRAIWFPDVLRDVPLPRTVRRIARFFPGLKENLYLDRCELDYSRERTALGISTSEYLVVSRPPADTAHYASDDSTRMWLEVMRHLKVRGVRQIVVPRLENQRTRIRELLGPETEILSSAVDGPSLVAAADLVVSGGGTMTREAAVLGVPAWSVFCGPTPGVDACLSAEGRVRWIRTSYELDRAFAGSLPSRGTPRGPFTESLSMIVADLEERLKRAG